MECIDGCDKPVTGRNRYCHTHIERMRRFGSYTPTVICFGCKKEFVWVGAGYLGNRYCNDCIDLLRKHIEYIPPSRRQRINLHGLTLVDYIKILINQDFKCVIPSCEIKDRLCIDHDHNCCAGTYGCNKCIRGLICFRCNTLVGYLEKNANLLGEVNKYIEYNRAAI